MFTTKTRTLIASLAAAVAVAVVPASAHALKAVPTGDKQHDDYCAGVATLIDRATNEAAAHLANGNNEEAAAWIQLGNDLKKRAEANGCDFVMGRKVRRALRELRAAVGPTVGEPGISTGGTSTGGTTPRLPVGDGPTVSGPMAG